MAATAPAHAEAPQQPGIVDEALPSMRRPRSGAGLDAAWLFLLAGVVVLAAAVLIPAIDDTAEVCWERDRARVYEAHRHARIDRYGQYLAAIDRHDPGLYSELAAGQLNLIPENRAILTLAGDVPVNPAMESRHVTPQSQAIFASLEPPPMTDIATRMGVSLTERSRVGSTLERWAIGDATRPWLIAFGGLCVLIGVLPPVTSRAAVAPTPR